MCTKNLQLINHITELTKLFHVKFRFRYVSESIVAFKNTIFVCEIIILDVIYNGWSSVSHLRAATGAKIEKSVNKS